MPSSDHSVIQSDALNPCRRKEGGFDSGFRPNLPNVEPPKPFEITVEDPAAPIWAYCAQALGKDDSHCERKGQSFIPPLSRLDRDGSSDRSSRSLVSGMLFGLNVADQGPLSFAEVQKVALATVLGSPPKAAGAPAGTIALVGGGAGESGDHMITLDDRILT